MLDGSSVSHFAVHLPLSTDFSQLAERGTRHAAALGLAERSDAFCIVVSEERGRISIASEGRLEELDGPMDLTARLESFLKQRVDRAPSGTGTPALAWRRNWVWKLSAVAIALVA